MSVKPARLTLNSQHSTVNTQKIANMKGLSTQSLSLAYDGVPIIRDLNLAIPTGKISALVGANGCGKSTLLRGLARLLKPYGGTVHLDGQSIFSLATKEVAKQLGILPQGPVAPEGLTVKDLVGQGRYPYQNWLQQWSEKDEIIVQQALEITNLLSLADRALDTLSGGQRQRAWIAMALAQDTDILLLDEPASALDPISTGTVEETLVNLKDDYTIIIVTHNMQQAARISDYTAFFYMGKVIEYDHTRKIFTRPKIQATEDYVSGHFG